MASGITLIIGITYVSTLAPLVDDMELPDWILYAPATFIPFGIMIVSIGIISYTRYKKTISKQ